MMSVVYMIAALIAAFSNVFADNNNDAAASCEELMKPENRKFNCCATLGDAADSWKQCELKDAETEFTCEYSTCTFDKNGLIQGKNIDKPKVRKLLTDIGVKHPQLTALTKKIHTACMENDKYRLYESEENCEPAKLQLCIIINSVMGCQVKDTEECKIYGDHVRKCNTLIKTTLY